MLNDIQQMEGAIEDAYYFGGSTDIYKKRRAALARLVAVREAAARFLAAWAGNDADEIDWAIGLLGDALAASEPEQQVGSGASTRRGEDSSATEGTEA